MHQIGKCSTTICEAETFGNIEHAENFCGMNFGFSTFSSKFPFQTQKKVIPTGFWQFN